MRFTRRMASSAVVFAAAFFANASSAWADFITFSASNGSGLSASVTFDVTDGILTVTLTNTSTSDVGVPAQVLTAVFFSLPGSLTAVSADVADDSWVNNGAGGDVGGEWAYKSGLTTSFGSNSGISSTGLGIFGEGDLFGGANLDGPEAPNGLQYGITSAGDDPTTGNTPVTTVPLIQNSVVFVLDGWDESWSLSDITNVVFQYGTSLDEPNLAVPEPGVLVLMGIGVLGLVFGVRRMSWA